MADDQLHVKFQDGGEIQDSSTIYVAGDFTISSLNDKSEPKSFITNSILDDIRNSDLSLVNYEGVTAEGVEPVFKGGPIVEIDRGCPRLLANSGFTGVTLANNHVVDYGPDGIRQTIDVCEKEGLKTLGTGANIDDAVSPNRFDIDGTAVSIFNFSEHPIHSYDYDGTTRSIADISHPSLSKLIHNEKEIADIIIAIAHAGFMWVPVPPVQLQQQYRNLIEMGADVVVGHHPHVPQGWEQYQKGAIFYSLGNFLYDRSGRETSYPENWGLTLKIHISDSDIYSIDVVPIEVVNRRVCHLGKNRSREKWLNRLYRMNEIVCDDEELKLMWMAIARKYFQDRRDEIVNNEEIFLYRMIWPSHQYMLETALISEATNIEIPEEVEDEALRMWYWSNERPFETQSTMRFRKAANLLYSGPVRHVSQKTGLHPHVHDIYHLIKDNLRKKDMD